MKITVKVIGTRYELNDPYICVIGKLIKQDEGNKPRVKVLGGDENENNIIEMEEIE
jgi:hypothetical protein